MKLFIRSSHKFFELTSSQNFLHGSSLNTFKHLCPLSVSFSPVLLKYSLHVMNSSVQYLFPLFFFFFFFFLQIIFNSLRVRLSSGFALQSMRNSRMSIEEQLFLNNHEKNNPFYKSQHLACLSSQNCWRIRAPAS